MIRRLLYLLLFMPFVLTFGQYQRPGSTTAQFLKIGISPRSTGMGDAYISVVEGAEAAYYNSAALANLKGSDFVFNYNKWFSGINHNFAGVAHNFSDEIGTVALSVTALYTDEMKVRTPLQPDGTGETFYSGNYRLGLSYAMALTDHVSFGGTLNYIYMSLYSGFSGQAVSADIGVLYKSDFRNFSFGMQISNFGSDITFVNEAYPLPANFTFGASINAVESEDYNFLTSFSVIKPNDGGPLAGMGGELSIFKRYFLRGGYRFNHSVAKYTFGTGVMVDFSGFDLKFDYSYSDYSFVGGAHRFGIGMGIL